MQVNLFLRVVQKRPDGYHDLASLFHVRSPRQSFISQAAKRGSLPEEAV